MKYIEYIQLLNKNNIKLFDHDKRISFNNIKLFDINIGLEQKGGGDKLNNKSKVELKNIVDISLSSQPNLLLSVLN